MARLQVVSQWFPSGPWDNRGITCTTTTRSTPMSAPSPLRRVEPDRIADDTYVIRQIMGEGTAPVAVYVNSMVIAGAEPTIVDFGPTVNGDAWLEDVFSIVEPEDVRWLFLSHDDPDHTGNLLEVLERASNATLVTNWFSVERLPDRVLAAAPPDALGERRRVVRRRRPHLHGDDPADLRRADHPRAVRLEVRRVLGRRRLRHAGDARRRQHLRARSRLLAGGLPPVPAARQPVAPLARPGQVPAAPRPRRRRSGRWS